jgi:hypothetical protein
MPAYMQLYMSKFPVRITTGILQGVSELAYGYKKGEEGAYPRTKGV